MPLSLVTGATGSLESHVDVARGHSCTYRSPRARRDLAGPPAD